MIMADKNGLLETAKGGIFFRKKKTRIIVNELTVQWRSPSCGLLTFRGQYAFHVCVEDQKCRRGEDGTWRMGGTMAE